MLNIVKILFSFINDLISTDKIHLFTKRFSLRAWSCVIAWFGGFPSLLLRPVRAALICSTCLSASTKSSVNTSVLPALFI